MINPRKLVKQYREIQAEAEKAKPKSQRKTVLQDRLKRSMTELLAVQNRKDKAA